MSSSTASLTEIESAIQKLSQSEVRQLADWLQTYVEDQWDQQIKEDAEAGKFDELIAEAKADFKAGKLKSLDEVIYNP